MSGIDVEEEWKILIGGEHVSTENHYDIIDPNTTEVIGHAPEATDQHAIEAAAAAKEALRSWKALSMDERCGYIGRAADAIESACGDWVNLVQAETGATIRVARTMQVAGAFVDRFRYYSRPHEMEQPLAPLYSAASALAPESLITGNVIRQPVGVVACITPYNFPLVNVAGKLAPALAMGNTAVIKPAPQDPLAIIKLGEILNEVLPPGVVNVIVGSSPDVGAALVDTKDVDMISFTGSSTVGAKIMESGGKTMKRLLMELGGKGALIMTEDCDVQAAVGGIASVWGFHSGQICTAPTRVICHRDIYEPTIEALKAVSEFMTVGDAREEGTLVGPVITESHRDRVEAFIQSGIDDGAEVVVGGERPKQDGFFVAPTLLTDCTPDMHVVKEEAFGPVVVVMPHDGDDHAVELANNSDYGLFSYVYAGNTTRAYEIAQKLESGNVALNSIAPHMYAPFGGFKMSGVGRDRGRWGLEAYSEIQAINWPS
ncbi:MAG: aldehyde dehydrogenase family protein [Acidimicrobiales bacterium]|nr:aldehyde dehydrogenase family protein [Acidimicrobiales bacterium]MDG1845980.1 aldehyde dehydrogenase family protein [Acidimicrobiales bacterium]